MEKYQTPFDFKTTDAGGQIITIQCQQILRSVPGRRLACLARFQGKPVFVKLFIHQYRAQRHLQRETQGIQLLLENSIPVPNLLFAGNEKDGPGRVLVQELKQNTINLIDEWNKNYQNAFEYVEKIITLVVKMHLAGISQQDIHPDNFLLTDDGPYCIDTAMLNTSDGPLPATESIRNIALFAAQFLPVNDDAERKIWQQYCQLRDESWYEKYISAFEKEVVVCRRTRAEKLLGKLYRTSSKYIYHEAFRKRFCIKKSWYEYYSDGQLIMPDVYFSKKNIQYLKQGGSSTVIKVGEQNKELVIKRYNIKDSLHALKRAFRRTRASRSWAMSHLLEIYGINTPAPVAFLENKVGPIKRVSYFICEYVPGPNLLEYFPDNMPLTNEQKTIADKVVLMLQNLGKAGIYHGDMKATNIIINKNKVWLLDLDAMCWHQESKKSAPYHRKDIKRFLRNWDDETPVAEYFREKLGVK